MKRYFLQTFGCQMNMHDSRRIEDVLRAQGFQATDAPEEADLLLFNTCSVRDKAEHKLVSAVGALRPLKESRRDLIVVIAGCMAQQYGKGLIKKIDFVDLVIGPDHIEQLPSLIQKIERGRRPLIQTGFDLESPRFLRATVRPNANDATAFVTIMKGCNERCAFCIVPTTRGSERYRPADDIIEEIQQLVEGGVREVTLLGQTVNSWRDPSREQGAAPVDFTCLLRRIASEVPGLWRLRYTASHPRYVTSGLVRAHAELEVLPLHVHLPVQSGSDRVLKRMIRRYRRATYVEKVRELQKARPGLTLSTDLIVGFPGETEEDFEQTLSLVREVGFATAFAFKYSPRPGTPALKLGDPVPEPIKDLRLARLFELVDAQQTAHNLSLVGTHTQVLLEGPNAKSANIYSGRSHRHEIVHVTCPKGRDYTGKLVDVVIEHANKHSLMASLAEEKKTFKKADSESSSSPTHVLSRAHNEEALF
jgi:tRNA-2-methylthio-N6-dimethylallyladenosine synthase